MADYNSSFTGAQIDAAITKVGGIEAGADVTDTANVTAAGALMDSEVTNLADVKAFDPADYATAAQGSLADSATQPGDDADTLGSGAATDGWVLTADGIGGAAWEASAGGGGSTDYVRTRAGTVQDLFDMAETWNEGATTFTSIKMNVTDTASASGSLLMDLQVGGTSKFSVRANPSISLGATFIEVGNNSRFFDLKDNFGTGFIRSSGGSVEFATGASAGSYVGGFHWSGGVCAPTAGFLGFAQGNSLSNQPDLRLYKDAANTLAQRNGTNAQTFNLYGTYTDASNLRRLVMTMSGAGVAEIKPDGLGTGLSGNVLHISGLPTSNPGPGILWNNAGTVEVGT